MIYKLSVKAFPEEVFYKYSKLVPIVHFEGSPLFGYVCICAPFKPAPSTDWLLPFLNHWYNSIKMKMLEYKAGF